MGKSRSPSFIHELKLKVNPRQERVLNTRLEIARHFYNACLGEGLKRLRLMRESKTYRKACKLPKQIKNRQGKWVANQERQKLFKAAREYAIFDEYGLHDYVKVVRGKTLLSQHIDSSVAQKLATRAFQAVEVYAYGKRGRPRFRAKQRFSSVEGKRNDAGICFVDGKIRWFGFSCELHFDAKDKHGLEAHALACRTKYVRLVRRMEKGSYCWYAQLVQEGMPYRKPKNRLSEGVVGLDLGPSGIAMVQEEQAVLQGFCHELIDVSAHIRRLQRKMSRSLRQMNTDNFEVDKYIANSNGRCRKKQGKVKRGAKQWIKSKRYQRDQKQLIEWHRKMRASRKSAHGRLVNDILREGSCIKTEKLSYKAWQKKFGKSIGRCAPGLFMEKLRYKAANAGGEVIEFKTSTTALSQRCHCGERKKKPLKQRWHMCSCGVRAQRDLYSAFLARFVKEERLDRSQAVAAWPGAGIFLEQALSDYKKTTSSKLRLACFGLGQRQSGSSAKEESIPHKALDVVAIA